MFSMNMLNWTLAQIGIDYMLHRTEHLGWQDAIRAGLENFPFFISISLNPANSPDRFGTAAFCVMTQRSITRHSIHYRMWQRLFHSIFATSGSQGWWGHRHVPSSRSAAWDLCAAGSVGRVLGTCKSQAKETISTDWLSGSREESLVVLGCPFSSKPRCQAGGIPSDPSGGESIF